MDNGGLTTISVPAEARFPDGNIVKDNVGYYNQASENLLHSSCQIFRVDYVSQVTCKKITAIRARSGKLSEVVFERCQRANPAAKFYSCPPGCRRQMHESNSRPAYYQ